MEYIRPKYDDNLNKKYTVTVSRILNKKDPYTGIDVPYQVSLLEPQDLGSDGSLHFKSAPEIFTNNDLINRHEKYLQLKAQCGQIAENLLGVLRAYLIDYYIKKGKDHSELFVIDFSGLRDILSEIVHHDDDYRQPDEFNSKPKRKNFTKNFTEFIEDRNIYTHGQLYIRVSDFAVVITYIEKKYKKSTSCIVNEQIVESFFKNFSYLNAMLTIMRSVLSKSPG